MSTTELTSPVPINTVIINTVPQMGAKDVTAPVAGESNTTTASPAGEQLGELVMADPRELIIGVNVRRNPALDRGFQRDIAERGVRAPITVRRDEHGGLVVLTGQRRTLAAVQAGLRQVRVFIDPDTQPDEPDRSGRVERIIDQLGENNHRTAVTTGDRVAAHQQLLDLGLTAGQIARRTHTPTREVRALNAVAASSLVSGLVDCHELTLDQAAAIAEFDAGPNTDTDVVTALTAAATRDPQRFPHVLQRARDEREESRLIREQQTQLREQGVRLLEDDEAGKATPLCRLRASTHGPDTRSLTPDTHADCPGRAARVSIKPRFRQGPLEVDVVHYCTDPASHGHVDLYGHTGQESRSAPMSDEQKAQRRLVIARNKAWDSATQVRLEWVATLLRRKTAPKDAALFIAITLARGSSTLRKAMESGHRSACALLGLAEPPDCYSTRAHPITALLATANPQRATQLSLAVILGALEQGTGRHSWRTPDTETSGYLRALHSWGYPLSEVETLALDTPNTDPASQDSDGTGDASTPDPVDNTAEDNGGITGADADGDGVGGE